MDMVPTQTILTRYGHGCFGNVGCQHNLHGSFQGRLKDSLLLILWDGRMEFQDGARLSISDNCAIVVQTTGQALDFSPTGQEDEDGTRLAVISRIAFAAGNPL